MYAGLTLVTPPVAEPVSVADAKKHSRVLNNAEDSLIAGYISVARMKVETHLWRALLTQQWRFALQNFPGRPRGVYRESTSREQYDEWSYIQIPLPPLVSVDLFTYRDTENNLYLMQQGFSNVVGNYFVDLNHEPGRACLPFAGIWPVTILLPSAPIEILFTAGWPFWTGTVDVDASGIATLPSPPNGPLFDNQIVGTWITINDVSYDVVKLISPTEIKLATPPPAPITGGTYTANAVPMPIRMGILFLMAHLYENREPVIIGRGEVAIEIPSTLDDILAPYRCFEYTNQGADS